MRQLLRTITGLLLITLRRSTTVRLSASAYTAAEDTAVGGTADDDAGNGHTAH